MINIKTGDLVEVLSGKEKGKKGKIVHVFPKEGKVVIDGLNIKKKHRKPRKAGEKGQVIEISAPLSASAVMLVCPKCGKPSRTGVKFQGTKKVRVCKKCNQEI